MPSWRITGDLRPELEEGRRGDRAGPGGGRHDDQAVPVSVLVAARLDSDGDPTTRPPTDPRGRADDVKIGTKKVKVVLERP